MKSKSVVVVGAGIVGMCTAHYLSEAGFEVTVIDRSPAGEQGCSYGNAGMIVPSHFIPLAAPGMIQMGMRMMLKPKSPFALHFRLSLSLIRWTLQFAKSATRHHVDQCAPIIRDMNLASRACFEALVDSLGYGLGFERRGLLMLCKESKTLDEEGHVAETANELGLHAKVYDGDGLAKLDPTIKMNVAGGVHFEDDCHISSIDFMQSLDARLNKSGVRFVHGAELISFKRSGSKIDAVCTTKGDFAADEYVIATGAWSEAVMSMLSVRVPVQPGKGYSMTLEHPIEQPALCSILTEARVAVTPMNNKLRFAGTMEIGAAEQGVNRNRVEGIIDSIPAFFPSFRPEHFRNEPVWSGLRPCSPDGMPYIGRTAANNLCLATGHAMMGLSLGPITGKLVAEILTGQNPTIDLRLLNPDRFNR